MGCSVVSQGGVHDTRVPADTGSHGCKRSRLLPLDVWLGCRPPAPPLQEAKAIGDEFLQLEKYVNLNYMGFHKVGGSALF